jgi:CelD/BcsL family acetyltransferase involved in cellulose biosynthesis
VKNPTRLAPGALDPRPCTFAELDRPDSLLNMAAASSPQADPFCCRSEWQLSFHEAFAPRRPLLLRAAGASVVAFALRRHPRLGALLEPLESHWCFGCPLLGADATLLLGALLDEEMVRRLRPSVLVSGLLPGGALVRKLGRAFGNRYELLRLAPEVLCSASLEGGLDGFLARRSARLRKRLRQAERRAAASGVRFERCVPRGAPEADAAYARMIAVERTSWKGIGRCGMAEPPALQFYQHMLRRLSASGAGRVMFARAGERDVGFIFGGLAGAHYRGQQFSYAEDWAPYSLGNLLQLEQVRWLCEEGVLHYDMGPRMDYKSHWTEREIGTGARLLRPAHEA